MRENGGELVEEAVYLEVEPDRGGKEIAGPLSNLVVKAKALDAQIIYINFGSAIG